MGEIRIKVECYEGYRGAERPAAFYLHGEKVAVISIHRSWVEEGHKDRRRMRCFRVSGSDLHNHTLCHDETEKEWFYLSPPDATSTAPS